jgi:hypothetical protein
MVRGFASVQVKVRISTSCPLALVRVLYNDCPPVSTLPITSQEVLSWAIILRRYTGTADIASLVLPWA